MIRRWITFNCTCQPNKNLHQAGLAFQSKPCTPLGGSACSSSPDLSGTALKYLLGKEGKEWELSLKLLMTQVTFYPCISENLKHHFLVKSYVKNSNQSCFDTEQLITWLLVHLQGGKMSQHSHGQRQGSSSGFEETPSVHGFKFRNKALTLSEIHSFKSLRFFPFWLLGMQGKAATKTRWIPCCLLNLCSLCKTYEFSGSKPAGNPRWKVHLISHVLLQFLIWCCNSSSLKGEGI